MSQQHPAVAERARLRRRNATIAMVFAMVVCLGAGWWAATTLGVIGSPAAAGSASGTTPPSVPDPQVSPVETEAGAAPVTTTAAPAAPVTRFVSPSGNIACAISEQLARCDLADKAWDPGPPPADCALPYGAGVMVDAAGPRVTCAADSLVGSGGDTLEYGRDVVVGDFSCTSSEAGMRCAQASTGRGFSVSRRAYTFF